MVVDKTAKPAPLRTLKEVHELLMNQRPREDAPLPVWLEYRQRSAKLYAQIADIDRFHHHEAGYWAELEQQTAKNIAAQINAGKSPSHRTRKGGEG
ncbi:MAG TPA: AMED_5909 family protein [Pseudonocardiaceae bacterium]|jgi:hypothetical protein|nr:AMED_5909 family protein [Pseudonocardiaceae bacterium]